MNIMHPQLAGRILLVSLVILAGFHILSISDLVRSGIVWGLQFRSRSGAFLLTEAVSLLVTGGSV